MLYRYLLEWVEMSADLCTLQVFAEVGGDVVQVFSGVGGDVCCLVYIADICWSGWRWLCLPAVQWRVMLR